MQGDIVLIAKKLWASRADGTSSDPQKKPNEWTLFIDLNTLIPKCPPNKPPKSSSSSDSDSDSDDSSSDSTSYDCDVPQTPDDDFFENDTTCEAPPKKRCSVMRWKIGEQYAKGARVRLEEMVYCAKVAHLSSADNRPAVDPCTWTNVGGAPIVGNPLIYAMLLNGGDNFSYNKETGISEMCEEEEDDELDELDTEGAPTHYSSGAPDMFQKLELSVKPKSSSTSAADSQATAYERELVPINYVAKNNMNFYDFDEHRKSISILQPGYYRITYCVAYQGPFKYMETYTLLPQEDGPSKQVCASQNLGDCLESHVRYTNHTFTLPVKEHGPHKIELHLTPLSKIRNTGPSKVSIKPVNTWITIERTSGV
jgi:hypothetical protein